MMRISSVIDAGTVISNREVEVLRMISFEHTTNEIAHILFISPHTVVSHRKNMMSKMNVSNTAGLIRKGFEMGILNC